jgi:hypothetical protein
VYIKGNLFLTPTVALDDGLDLAQIDEDKDPDYPIASRCVVLSVVLPGVLSRTLGSGLNI